LSSRRAKECVYSSSSIGNRIVLRTKALVLSVISNICACRISVVNDDDLSAAVRSAEKDKEEEREGKVWRHFCKENIFSSTNHLLILFHFFSKPVEY
jgi:hypothetical protein